MFIQALRNKSNTRISERKSIVQPQPSIPSINSIEDKELDKKNEIFKKFSVGIARAVLNQNQEEEQKNVQQQKERHNQEIERQHQNYKPQYGTKIYNNQLIKGITVTIEPLSKEQRAQAEQRRMINDVFSQVESISKLKPSFTNLPQDNQKLPLLQINSPVSFKHNFLQRQSSLDPMSVKMAKQLYSNSQIQPDFTQKNQQAVASQVFGLTQQPSQQAQIQQQQQYNQQQQQIQLQQKKNSQLNNPFSISNQAQSQYQNQQPKKINAIKNQEQNSFDDDFNIDMPNYQRYRTFFFKPLERENMFEGMKYIQYEQYIRKDDQMQNVMVLDLTKILSDKCYTFKTTIVDKNKMKRVFGSLRPQLRLEVNKRLEETISLFESISFLLMRDFRDNLQDVGIGQSPLEIHKEIRTQNLNIIFRNMHKNFYIEHVFNQIFDEEFQEKFMEQTLQEQYEILVTIKKNLKTLCEKIQQRIELYQNHQEIFQMQQFKLEDDSDFKEYLKSIESIIHQTKQLPSTQVVLEKKKNQKKPKKKKLLDDSSFESNKSIEILYEVFRTKPIQNEAKEPLKNEPVLRRIGGSIATQNQQQIQQNVVPSIQLMNNTPQNQVSLVKQFQAEQQNIQINSSQVQDSNQTPFRRKILRNFDSQTSTPQNLKPQMELVHAESSIMNHEDNKFNPQKSMFQSPSNLMSSQVQMQNQLMYSQQQQNGGMITSQLQQQLSSQQSQQQQQQQQQQVRNLQNTQSTKTQQKRIDFQETNNKLMQEQHQPYKKMVIKDMGDEYLVFEDNLFLYEKTSDFMRDCIDSYRIMCRQKEFNKFDDYSLRKFLRYCTKVRFNISELVEQFRNYEKSIEQKFYWKSIMSKTMSSMMNFESAQKYMFRTTTAASTMQSPSKFQSQDSQENTNVESRKQRIGRLQSVLSDKFNFSKRQAQTRESKVELNNQKFEQEKQLLMDSHLAPEEVTHVIADNRRKLALQRLRNPFIEPFKKKQPQLQQSQSDKNLNLKGNQKKKEQQPQEETNQKQLNKKATQSNKH